MSQVHGTTVAANQFATIADIVPVPADSQAFCLETKNWHNYDFPSFDTKTQPFACGRE
jgi:hypothetical protein